MKHIAIKLMFIFLGILFLGGCGAIENITPAKVFKNKENTYTFKTNFNIIANIDSNKIRGYVVVGNSVYKLSYVGGSLFEYDYKVPADITDINYYYIFYYDRKGNLKSEQKSTKYQTDLFSIKIESTYVLSMDSISAVSGSKISIYGKGFTESTKVLFGNTVARKISLSDSKISFVVPSLKVKRDYKVSLMDGKNKIKAGVFRVLEMDGQVSIVPNKVTVDKGKKKVVLLSLPEVSSQDRDVKILTDISGAFKISNPKIRKGTKSVTLDIEGLKNGEGRVYVYVYGYPVNVFDIQIGQKKVAKISTIEKPKSSKVLKEFKLDKEYEKAKTRKLLEADILIIQ